MVTTSTDPNPLRPPTVADIQKVNWVTILPAVPQTKEGEAGPSPTTNADILVCLKCGFQERWQGNGDDYIKGVSNRLVLFYGIHVHCGPYADDGDVTAQYTMEMGPLAIISESCLVEAKYLTPEEIALLEWP